MVSDVAALSSKNDKPGLDLTAKTAVNYLLAAVLRFSSGASRCIVTDPCDIFRYAAVGVRRSAGIVTHKGTRFGAPSCPKLDCKTSSTSGRSGSSFNIGAIC